MVPKLWSQGLDVVESLFHTSGPCSNLDGFI